MENNQIQYPLFFNCGSQAAWEEKNKAANVLLGLGNAGADNYSNPIIDANGDHWFVVNPEVSSLVDLTLCVDYDKIVLPENKI